jgi:TolA-binding protein
LATILYRIADSYVALQQPNQAVEALQEIGQAFPQSQEAKIAADRIQYLLDNSNSATLHSHQV